MKNSEIKIGSERNFGIVFSVVFLIIAIYPLIKGNDLQIWSLIVSILFLALGLINSKLLRPLNKLWFRFGLFLGKIISPIIMGFIFFFVVTPTGLIMRILRKDLLSLNYNKNKSYWIEKKGPKSKMKNQF